MDLSIKEKFLTSWENYFGEAELPITCYYGDDWETADKVIQKDISVQLRFE